jgi:hypothetical protein
MHLIHSVAALVAVLSGLLVLAGPAAAQTSTYPESMLKISYEPRMIAAQLQAAAPPRRRRPGRIRSARPR